MSTTKLTPRTYYFLAIAQLSLGLGIAYFSSQDKGLPDYDSLQKGEGHIAWVKSNESGIDFGLVEEKRTFGYASKNGTKVFVQNFLMDAGKQKIKVLYDEKDPVKPIFSDELIYPVYELSVSGTVVKSYSEIADAWKTDNQIGVWLGTAFMLFGAYFLFQASSQSQQLRKKGPL